MSLALNIGVNCEAYLRRGKVSAKQGVGERRNIKLIARLFGSSVGWLLVCCWIGCLVGSLMDEITNFAFCVYLLTDFVQNRKKHKHQNTRRRGPSRQNPKAKFWDSDPFLFQRYSKQRPPMSHRFLSFPLPKQNPLAHQHVLDLCDGSNVQVAPSRLKKLLQPWRSDLRHVCACTYSI